MSFSGFSLFQIQTPKAFFDMPISKPIANLGPDKCLELSPVYLGQIPNSICHINFGRSALVNAVKCIKMKCIVEFHLTFIVDSKVKQDAKTGLVVVR